MKKLTVRISDALAAEIASEARATGVSKSEVVRRRLSDHLRGTRTPTFFDMASDLVGNVDDPTLPADLSARTKHYMALKLRAAHR